MTGYANWHSGEVESLVPVGSSPTSVTGKENDPVVQRRRRLGDNQETGGSIPSGIILEKRSVGVLAAHLLGKEEDPVQLRDGPLDDAGRSSNGKTLGLHPGNRGSIPRRSTGVDGLMVQWEDASSANWRSGFNSRSVH